LVKVLNNQQIKCILGKLGSLILKQFPSSSQGMRINMPDCGT
jgi:hypothetical protein